MNRSSPKEISETEEFIKNSKDKMVKGQDLQIVILKIETGEFLGCAGIHKINTDTPTLGIWTKKSAHGHGFGKEAITALKSWADENLKYKYLIYPVDKRNIPSRKIPESLGGLIAGEYKKTNQSGKVLQTLEYRIYRS